MKMLFSVIMMLLITNVTQGEESKTNPEFETRKTEVLKHIDERVEALNKFKGCVSAATKGEDLKSCHQAHRESLSEMRMEMMDDRIERMQKRREKMKERNK